MHLFSIDNIAFQVAGYNLSYIELLGTLFGLISVYYASRANVLTWPTGIINEIALFALFYQVQLYADMFLQVYFLIVTIFGWRKWKSNTADVPVIRTDTKGRLLLGVILLAGTLLIGTLIMHINHWLPAYFPQPASYPFPDAFVMTGSILATVLLARKQLENWYLWIIVDIVSVVLYLVKGIYFLSAEYVIFLVLASYGCYQWTKKQQHD
jgi:nicotinamide mononucleotide transporter